MARKTTAPSSPSLSLFAEAGEKSRHQNAPLAHRMAPQSVDDFFGQEHILAPGKMLRRAIEADRLHSAVFFGPPGCGKTVLAHLVARRTEAVVEELNAVTAGVADVRGVIERAKDRRALQDKPTLLILDEIHRFNRSQQDALLPDVERGVITLIGLTTENPFFYVNSALLSRAPAFEFKPLSDRALAQILDRALTDPENGYGRKQVRLDPDAREHLLHQCSGDARRLLNALELAVLTTAPGPDGVLPIPLSIAEECVQKRALIHDKSGDAHYDIASAFIKSLRGGDPDAALYWMARLLAAGDDPRFVARRLVILASEDVGNADPRGLVLANAGLSAVEFVGMPEARIILAQVATYLACAPKSNAAYLGIERALAEAEKGPRREVPNHLKDGTMDRQALGHGEGYLYPHDFPGHYVPQVYWPNPKPLYEPGDLGEESRIKARLAAWRSGGGS